MYETTGYLLALILLGSLSAGDIKSRTIPVWGLLLWMGTSLVYLAAGDRLKPYLLLSALLPGMTLLLVSFLTGEKIGLGDGAVAAVLGLFTDGIFCTLSLCAGFLLAGLYGLYCLAAKKREPIPFLPFLLAGMEVMLLF